MDQTQPVIEAPEWKTVGYRVRYTIDGEHPVRIEQLDSTVEGEAPKTREVNLPQPPYAGEPVDAEKIGNHYLNKFSKVFVAIYNVKKTSPKRHFPITVAELHPYDVNKKDIRILESLGMIKKIQLRATSVNSNVSQLMTCVLITAKGKHFIQKVIELHKQKQGGSDEQSSGTTQQDSGDVQHSDVGMVQQPPEAHQ